MSEAGNAIISIQVDAFVFNEAVVEAGEAYRIAPISQPDYSFLSLDKLKVHNDILRPVDLQNAVPAKNNSRLYDLGTGKPRQNRIGVYVHWILPTMYRTGEQQTETRRGRAVNSTNEVTTPDYKPVPNRWLVIRRIKAGTMKPEGAGLPEYESWVVESDRLRDVTELTDDIDTQVDISPYVGEAGPHQGRDFIGYKTNAIGWAEDSTARHIDLNVMSSSNQLFADYQPHNGNVFSLVDNFSYQDGTGATQYLQEAEASYFVFGWHSDAKSDPLYYSGTGRSTISGLLERLEKRHLHLREELPADLLAASVGTAESTTASEDEPDPGNATICCGTIHSVIWNQAKPSNVPAENSAKLFQDPENLPISIGTGPLDALLTYLHAQEDQGNGIGELEELILKIQTLLISQDDGVDAQAQAEDELRNTDYDRTEGGVEFHLAGENEEDESPPPDKLNTLRQANSVQTKLDSLKRTLPRHQWELFAEWWYYLCDGGEGRDETTISQTVSGLSDKITALTGTTGDESIYYGLPALVQQYIGSVGLPCEPGAARRYNQQRDPTMLVAGMASGWPSDHLEESSAMMGFQLRASLPGETSSLSTADSVADILAAVPAELRSGAQILANKYIAVGDGSNPDNEPIWNGQPWCPLFLEWEAEYYHIPMKTPGDDGQKLWELDTYQVNQNATAEHLRWGIKKGVDLQNLSNLDLEGNMRTIDGRVLLLPQPAFSLKSKVDQLFTNIPPALLDSYISKEDRDKLSNGLLNDFPYMSCPLAGFTDHLLTIIQGTHIKPNIKKPGATALEPMPEAQFTQIGFDLNELAQIGEESGATPYSNLVKGLGQTYSPFKPATHGQFRFTKINIVDKFGQAISVIDQSPAQHPPPIYPCISEMYACQTLNDGKTANTVIKEPDYKCQFIQLPPKINQPARLNAEFLIEDPATPGVWRPADDWENPIFGFLVVNFADYGLQIFLPDGRFYREVRLGGASGASLSQPWLPFGPPDEIPETNAQLEQFIAKLQDEKTYLEAVYTMIVSAFDHMEAAPNSYAEFLGALIGKPVALTNVGWSFELATDKYKNAVLGETGMAEVEVDQYSLPLKIGDKNRFYDGLIGYYEPDMPQTIYTHFPGAAADAPTVQIGKDPDDYPHLTPFFPEAYKVQPSDFVSSRDAKLKRVVALLDPFVALHGYTGILPVEDLKLPAWTVETALKKMTAFFHLGPVLTTKDVPGYDAGYKLNADYDPKDDKSVYPGGGLAIPATLAATDWMWLQPYVVNGSTSFMGMRLERLEEKPSWKPAPYTAVEGYLQLRQTIGKDDLDPENAVA